MATTTNPAVEPIASRDDAPPIGSEPAPPVPEARLDAPVIPGDEHEIRLLPDEAAIAMLLHSRRKRITLAMYHGMVEAGLLTPEDRVELIEGVLIEKMTKKPPHVIATDLIQEAIAPIARTAGYFLSMCNPLFIEGRSAALEPDLIIVRGHPRDYEGRGYQGGDAALVIEVADTSYPIDRRLKWPTYAAAGIDEYWILDLNRRLLEVHSEPTSEGYRALNTLGESDQVILVLDGPEVGRVAVAEFLPRLTTPLT